MACLSWTRLTTGLLLAVGEWMGRRWIHAPCTSTGYREWVTVGVSSRSIATNSSTSRFNSRNLTWKKFYIYLGGGLLFNGVAGYVLVPLSNKEGRYLVLLTCRVHRHSLASHRQCVSRQLRAHPMVEGTEYCACVPSSAALVETESTSP